MKNKLIFTVEKYRMPLKGRRVVVGFSGGSDSAALLSILNELAPDWELALTAAHVHHGIRGAEADRDEAFVREFCEKRKIPLRVARFDVPQLCKETGESVEECGRRLRYAFFRSIDPDALIATAHNLDDCAETFLLNLARGTGLKGLCGIPPVRDGIVRPLIDCTKAEILRYCEENGIPFVTDSTNLGSEYSRSRIRNEALPALRAVNPAFLSCFARTLSILKNDEAALDAIARDIAETARRADGYSVAELLRAPEPLRERTLSVVLRALTGTQPETRHIRAVASLLEKGGSENMNGGETVVVDGGRLRRRTAPEPPEQKQTVYTALPETAELSGGEIRFSVLTREEYEKNSAKNKKIYKEVFYYYLDCDTMIYPITVRGRREGDGLRPPGRGVTKSFKQLCAEKKIPAPQRGALAVLADAKGVLWAEGLGVDERAAVTDKTRSILQIEVKRRKNDERMH
ncbi:MAG: tRNA lysidine(34) synthetase TilS [Clostridia bacterium]|nr:tRNA lysidine(34) synthetase TilS [Clostridia bacterium]